MGFDNLWEKYGEKKEPEKTAESPERRQQEKKTVKQQARSGQTVKKGAPVYKKSNPSPPEYKAKAADAKGKSTAAAREKDSGPMPGVFGTDTGNTGSTGNIGNTGNIGERSRDTGTGSPTPSGRRSFDWGRMRYWPWVDIICITITAVMVIGVLANFEEVTTALFYALLPLLSNLTVLLLIVGLIAFVIWWITRRPRRRW